MSKLTNLYKEFCEKLDKEVSVRKNKFLSKLISDNAYYEKGQIIDNGIVRIEIDQIKFSVSFGRVSIVYIGKQFTKKNTPKKSGCVGSIYTDADHSGISIIDHARSK